jgi:hypothetical protein
MFLDRKHIVSAEALTRSKLVHVNKMAVDMSIKRDSHFARQVVAMLSRSCAGSCARSSTPRLSRARSA